MIKFIIALLIAIALICIWGFFMYIIIADPNKKDATKLIQMHIVTFISFFCIYTSSIMFDYVFDLNLWNYQDDLNKNIPMRILQGFYHTVIQHTTFGTSAIKSNSWLTRTFDVLHYGTSFFLNLSLLFEMLEETSEQGFNIFRAVGMKFDQFKKSFTSGNTTNVFSFDDSLSPSFQKQQTMSSSTLKTKLNPTSFNSSSSPLQRSKTITVKSNPISENIRLKPSYSL